MVLDLRIKRALIAVLDIVLREVESAGCHDLVFYHILYFFYGYSAPDLVAFIFDIVCDIVNLFRRKSGSFLRVVGLCNGRHNFSESKVASEPFLLMIFIVSLSFFVQKSRKTGVNDSFSRFNIKSDMHWQCSSTVECKDYYITEVLIK